MPPTPPLPPSPPPLPPDLPSAPPSPPANLTVVPFTTAAGYYYLYRSKASWTTAQEVCRARGLTLASWPNNAELYSIFDGGWDFAWAREFWVGVLRRVNTTVYEFVDGGTVPAIDGAPLDEYLELVDPSCVTDTRGCCVSLTDRAVGTYRGPYGTAKGPKLMARSCLTSLLYMCKGNLSPSPPPPSPPSLPLAADVELAFTMDFMQLVAGGAGRMADFRTQIAQLVIKEYSLTGSPVSVAVSEVFQDSRSGATVVHMQVGLPAGLATAAAPAFMFRLVNAPSTIFNPAFCANFLISPPIKGSLLAIVVLSPPPPGGSQQLGGGSDGSSDSGRAGMIAGLVGGLCLAGLITGGVVYMYHARKRAALRAVHEIH
ncbi:hypothetical protein GPECTOR_6g838 [Gonium pectorale]|uniref:C-type lectin domain-containing protein n=1 Tax=Gonium pectorale TaxID=33097 RepID=A0A150GX22_GONPE|nr:hypothetical protein GPECTOR_6g838 [Gonium pectorale]|eukprot:KXZ53920.1 hypothetical protein GPECTOR_6g838 [Gonium pectorale]